MAMTKISASFPYEMYAPAYMYSEQENGQFRLDTFPLDTFLPDRFPLEYFSPVLSRTYSLLDNFPTTIIISINAYIHTAIHEYIHTYIIYAHTYIHTNYICIYARVLCICTYVRICILYTSLHAHMHT